MKILQIFLLTVFVILSVRSQQNAFVNYKVKLLDSKFQNNKTVKNQEANDFIESLLIQSADFLKQSDFSLNVSDNKANFLINNSLAFANEHISKFAYAIIKADGLIYINTQTKQLLHQMDAFGSQVILVSNIEDQKWSYSGQTKEVSGYTCYKAQLLDEKSNITAWYAPKIALPFGPAGYGGLPGLILELEVQNEFSPYIYYVTNINLKPAKKITVLKPDKGKLVTKEELDKMGEKSKANFDTLRGNQ